MHAMAMFRGEKIDQAVSAKSNRLCLWPKLSKNIRLLSFMLTNSAAKIGNYLVNRFVRTIFQYF